MDIRGTILQAQDRKTVPCVVPEWGLTVWGGAMSGTDRDSFEAESVALRKARPGDEGASIHNFRARVLVRCLFDEKGDRIFSDADAALLGKKSGTVLDRLYDIVGPLAGMMEGDVASKAGESASSAPNAEPGSGTPSPTESRSPSSS